MKLIFCPACEDVLRLTKDSRSCRCGASWGWYLEDGLNAEIGGRAIPLGFDNGSFVRALSDRPKEGLGRRFEAFVIAEQCPTIVGDAVKPRGKQ